MEIFCMISNTFNRIRHHCDTRWILHIALTIFLATVALSSLAVSQYGQERIRRERTFGEPVFCEIHSILTSTDSANVEVLYKIRKDIFTFSRPIDDPTAPFSGSADITIEVLDSAGNSVTRNIHELPMTTEDNNLSSLKTQYCEGLSSFRLHYGKYSLLLQITDRNSHASIPDIRRRFHLRPKSSPIRSDLIPVTHTAANDSEYRCFNLGGDIQFSHNSDFVFVMRSPTTQPGLRYSLKRIDMEDEDNTEVIVNDTTINGSFFTGMLPSFSEKDSAIVLSMTPDSQYTTIVIPFHSIMLKQGLYKVTVKADTAEITSQFRIRWLDMPSMLTDLDLAIIPLQYITTEDEYSELQSGNRAERIKKFDAFWQKKDPTPGTAYNELLAEFYKRADIAMTAYRTLKEFNGTLTDRGKIFILYGKPTKTERYLKPGDIPKEIWKYASHHKTFIFEDPSKQGNYKLAEIQ